MTSVHALKFCMEAHVQCGRNICTSLPTRWHECMHWNVEWQNTYSAEITPAPPFLQDDISAYVEMAHGSKRTVWKKHLHLHTYKKISVHALKCHMAQHVYCWSNICTSIPKRWHQCMRLNFAWQHMYSVEETSTLPSLQDDISACVEM
jgi:hypothetical protein